MSAAVLGSESRENQDLQNDVNEALGENQDEEEVGKNLTDTVDNNLKKLVFVAT